MPTTKIEELYQLIGGKMYDIIPDKWIKVYLYAEVLQDSKTLYFYFESTTRNKLVYCHDIPEEFGVNERIYWDLHRELIKCFEDLHEEFKVHSPQAWTNLTMYLDSTGKFNMDYNYDDISELSPTQQLTIWKYKVLGIYPVDVRRRKMVDDYINNKDTNHK